MSMSVYGSEYGHVGEVWMRGLDRASVTRCTLCIIAGILISTLLGCSSGTSVYRGRGIMTVHYLDVGQSDCTFVEIDGEHTLMIDATDREHAGDVVGYVKSLGYDSIDILLLTHPHSDHIGGAPQILDEFSIGVLYMTEYESDEDEYGYLMSSIEKHSVSTEIARRDVSFVLGGANGTFLSPGESVYEDENDLSAVLSVGYGEHRFLFMGDAGEEAEAELLSCGADLSATAVKAGHHGANTSSTAQFVAATAARYAVFSCGENNSYGHPGPFAVDRWRSIGARLFFTDRDSTVIICTDGTGILAASASDQEYWSGYTNIPGQLPNTLPVPETEEPKYVLNTRTHTVHTFKCSYARELTDGDREESSADLDRLSAEGYKKCKKCFN